MLFSYTYVPHQMEKMQEFIDFIFHEVWCNAPIGLVFHPDLFDGNLDLKEVMSEFGFSTKAADRGKAFYKDVKAIYELFAPLSAQEIDQLRQWYQGNNDLEKVCANDPTAQLARYADIAPVNQNLSDQLASFFKELYSQSLLDLAALRAKIGTIDDHYKAFVRINKADKCPFCGIDDLLGEYHTKREAYDHYLPKALYPFNSINFRNLVPACHHCNSSYKTSKDPATLPKDPARLAKRRKVFYPFSLVKYEIDLKVSLSHMDLDNLKPHDVTLLFGPLALTEEIETWQDVYGIEERYKAKLCSTDAKDWLENFRILLRRSESVESALADYQDVNPFANCNFLRNSFFKACQQAGVLDALHKYGPEPPA